MLLAYSLNKKVLPILEKTAEKTTNSETLGDVRAAIDAIKNQNHHFFLDRDHTGKITMNIE